MLSDSLRSTLHDLLLTLLRLDLLLLLLLGALLRLHLLGPLLRLDLLLLLRALLRLHLLGPLLRLDLLLLLRALLRLHLLGPLLRLDLLLLLRALLRCICGRCCAWICCCCCARCCACSCWARCCAGSAAAVARAAVPAFAGHAVALGSAAALCAVAAPAVLELLRLVLLLLLLRAVLRLHCWARRSLDLLLLRRHGRDGLHRRRRERAWSRGRTWRSRRALPRQCWRRLRWRRSSTCDRGITSGRRLQPLFPQRRCGFRPLRRRLRDCGRGRPRRRRSCRARKRSFWPRVELLLLRNYGGLAAQSRPLLPFTPQRRCRSRLLGGSNGRARHSWTGRYARQRLSQSRRGLLLLRSCGGNAWSQPLRPFSPPRRSWLRGRSLRGLDEWRRQIRWLPGLRHTRQRQARPLPAPWDLKLLAPVGSGA